jgi:pSer/pThr/pTyr-binding forkhead associated (FHA) protein
MFKLILKFQDTVVDEYTFQDIPVTIGRREDNDIVIDNMAVSGHHAGIETEDPNYYVLVDLDALNGTFLNENKVSRERVFDGDVIQIGKHMLVFEDLRPGDQRPAREAEAEGQKTPAKGFRDTVLRDTEAQKELLAKSAEERGISPEEIPEKPRKVEFVGSLTVIAGGTPEIIELSKRLTTLGKADDSDVKCSGFLVGKTAAIINKRPNGFFLAYAEGMTKPHVNGEPVSAQVQLHDGDEVSIGNTRMTFNMTEEIG